jgi:hypothetical protein
MERNREQMTMRGLSDNYNKDLKSLFKKFCDIRPRPSPRGKQKTNCGDPTAKVELNDLRLGYFRLHRQRTAQPKLACPGDQPQFSGIRRFLG